MNNIKLSRKNVKEVCSKLRTATTFLRIPSKKPSKKPLTSKTQGSIFVVAKSYRVIPGNWCAGYMRKKDEMLGEYDFSKGKRGPVLPNKGKTRITIFIDTDILEWFRD
jgi:hypothetical protein